MTDAEKLERKRALQREANRRWKANNPDKYKESWKKQNQRQHEKDREGRCLRQREYAAANREHIRQRNAEWRKNNPDRVALHRLRGHFKKSYGLTIEERDAMLLAQGNVCACCGSPEPKHKYGWVIDHCHTTGKVRGILCQPCNLTLGKVDDSIDHLKRLISYLEKHSE
jgi:hypothetical protein